MDSRIWDGDFDPPSIANTVKMGRAFNEMTLRGLARAANLSPAQISRIESDQVEKPAFETVVALARALNFNPVLMLIVAGHIQTDDAYAWLERFATAEVDDEDEREIQGFTAEDLAREPRSERAVRYAAMSLLSAPAKASDWDEAALQAIAASASQRPQDPAFEEIVELWGTIDNARRERILEFARDQHALSRSSDERKRQP